MTNKNSKFVILSIMTIIGLLFSKEAEQAFSDQHMNTFGSGAAELMPSQSVININNMAYWIKKSSAGTTSGSPNGTQADYPIGTGGLIYEDGMLWGVKVTDGNPQSPRVGGTTYYAGLKAGRVVYDASGNVIGSTDPADHHAWRVRKDYMTADLTADAANFGASVDDVYAQYDYDWNNWPADWGAPYNDVDANGAYDPLVDIPGYPGADQTLWVVANDVPEIVDATGAVTDTLNTAPNVYGADPVGIELQVTLWAYKFGASDPLGNIIFKKATMKYTGLPAGYGASESATNGSCSDAQYLDQATCEGADPVETWDGDIINGFDPAIANLDTVYFTQWSDPDLGTYTDDYVGCDIDLSFGYVYNGNAVDGVFNGIYQLPVPAGGYDFLQGPEVDGEYLPMTSFTYFGAGSSISDPDLSDYEGTGQFFNLMEGYLPRPAYPEQTPWTDLSTGEITNFVLSGDPVAGTGWIDGVQLPPGDRRLVMASGPFTMALGESQEVVLALVGGMGSDNISSVSVAKFHDTYAQYAYDNAFSLPSAPSSPVVQTTELDGEIILDWGYNAVAAALTEETVSQGFEFEGYNVYQLPSAGSPLSAGEKIATYDVINVVQTIFDPGVDDQSGFIIDQAKQSGTNSGVQRYYRTDYDELRNRDMSNGITYHFAVTAYSYLADNEGSPFKTLESSPTVVSVSPHPANPGFEWGSEAGSDVETTHTGTAGGSVSVSVVNPSDLTGDDYAVTFDIQHYYLNADGLWYFTDFSDSIGTLGRSDLTGSSVGGVGVYASTAGTIDLFLTVDVVSPDYNYADGVKLTFAAGIVINSASGGTITCVTTGQEVMCGDNSLSEGGAFSGGQVITVNVDTPTLPLNLDYIIYDDGWATAFCADAANAADCDAYGLTALNEGAGPATVNATGTATISEIGNDFKSIKHWNLVNTTTNTTALKDQFVMNGVTLENIVDGIYDEGGVELGTNANPIADGLQVDVGVGYDAPVNYESISDGGAWYGSESYTIGSYYDYGWAATAKSVDAYGDGHSAVDYLQRDVKMVWDGVYGDPDANGFVPVVSGGSQVWIYDARGYTLDAHTSPENTAADGEAFLITVPFKVYDMEPEGGGDPVQISLIMYDRVGDPATTPFYAFNPAGRMYTEFVLRSYDETLADFASNEAYLTWNTVWWGAPYTAGDEITFVYANPIQQGVDNWSFASPENTSSTVDQSEIDLISVYPNPYYGLHELETSRSEKFVSFNHLPEKATIRIFSLGGIMVREINKNEPSQFATWDLSNQYGYPVASGIYIVYVETDFGTKVLKLAVVQETQVLKYY